MPASQDLHREPFSWRIAAGVVILAALIRITAVVALSDRLESDPDGYRQIADHVIQSGVLGFSTNERGVIPTAYRTPLYPLALAAASWPAQRVTVVTAAALHVVCGVVTVLLVLLLARWWPLGQWSWTAGLLVALDPLLLLQSTVIMTETLATLLAACCLYALTLVHQRRSIASAVAAGAAVGLACLCRPTFLPWLALVVVTMPTIMPQWRQGFARALLLALAAALMLLPWGVRNYLHTGYPVLGTTHGGYALLWANNPFYYEHLERHGWRRVWQVSELDAWIGHQRERLTENRSWDTDLEWIADREAYDFARVTIRRHPGTFLKATVVRVLRLWDILPYQTVFPEPLSQRSLRYATGVWYAALFVLAVVGVYALRKRLWYPPLLWSLLLCLTFTAVHAIYASDPRMRAPLMPVVVLLAAAGISHLSDRTSRKML